MGYNNVTKIAYKIFSLINITNFFNKNIVERIISIIFNCI